MNKDRVIEIGFYGGLAIKAVNALVEFIGGLSMLILDHERLNRLIRLVAVSELREDPKDIVINYFISLGENLSISAQHSVAIYMLLHGLTKMVVIWPLLKKRVRAYPVAVVIFGLFITYESYSYLNSQSLLMLIIITIDIAIMVMIILEYVRLKAKNEIKR